MRIDAQHANLPAFRCDVFGAHDALPVSFRLASLTRTDGALSGERTAARSFARPQGRCTVSAAEGWHPFGAFLIGGASAVSPLIGSDHDMSLGGDCRSAGIRALRDNAEWRYGPFPVTAPRNDSVMAEGHRRCDLPYTKDNLDESWPPSAH